MEWRRTADPSRGERVLSSFNFLYSGRHMFQLVVKMVLD